MAEKSLDVIGVGSPLMDVLAFVDDDFLATINGAKGGMELVGEDGIAALIDRLPGEPTHVAGGSAANTIVGLAHLGHGCSFVGKLGTDAVGELYCELQREIGIDASRYRFAHDVATGRCLSLVTPDSERTMRTCLGAAAALTPDEITVDDFRDTRLVHIEGYLLFNRDLARQVLGSARQAGALVSLDLASFEVVQANAEILDELLDNYVDIVFANEDEARAYCGSDEPETGLHALAQHCDTVAVKLGAEGALLKQGDEEVRVGAHRVEAIDTTGAGDTWAAGFLHGYLSGCDLPRCGEYGAVLGAEVVQVLGAAIPPERWSDLRQLLT